MMETSTRFTVEPQPGRWDSEMGRIVTGMEDAAYKRGWNDACDQIVLILAATQAALRAGANPTRFLTDLTDRLAKAKD